MDKISQVLKHLKKGGVMQYILPINERAAQLPCQAMSGQNRTHYSYINSSKPVVKSVSKTNHAPLWEHESINVPDRLNVKRKYSGETKR